MPTFPLEVEINGKASAASVFVSLEFYAAKAEEIPVGDPARDIAFALLHECRRLQAELDKGKS